VNTNSLERNILRTMMRRYDCLALLAPLIHDELVIGNVAGNSAVWRELKPHPGNLYQMGMGLVTPLCLGLALALPKRRVVALEGDGSLLLNLGALATVANASPPNLTVVVLDNESYMAGSPTATAGKTDLEAIARGAGIKSVCTVGTTQNFGEAVDRAFKGGGPSVIVAKVAKEREVVSLNRMDGRENKYRFVRYIEETEQITILRPSAEGAEKVRGNS
jgi:thiamine pyrophosphate-dependent acetolactate synthase large subunit-like protein